MNHFHLSVIGVDAYKHLFPDYKAFNEAILGGFNVILNEEDKPYDYPSEGNGAYGGALNEDNDQPYINPLEGNGAYGGAYDEVFEDNGQNNGQDDDQTEMISMIGGHLNMIGGRRKGAIKKLKKVPAKMNVKKHAIKVNLARNRADFKSGNGEGVFAIPLSLEDFRKYQAGGKGTIQVMLLNDSFSIPSLVWGSVIEVELRGRNRPTYF